MSMQIALAFPGGILANVDCSFEAPFRCEVELVGTQGTLILPDAFLPPERAQLFIRKSMEPGATSETIDFEPANQYVEQVNAFCESIAAGRLLDPAETGVSNMRVLQTAIEQALVHRRECNPY